MYTLLLIFYLTAVIKIDSLCIPENSTSKLSVESSGKNAVYYHDHTIAVVNIGSGDEIKNCNLIEVYNLEETYEVLKNVSHFGKPQQISFEEMMKLIKQCEQFDTTKSAQFPDFPSIKLHRKRPIRFRSLTFLAGIVPGTKWCGLGDIAENYYDLGSQANLDRCCRSHDLCPTKVYAKQTQYNITNLSFYTKSHCTCDQALYDCLKALEHIEANIIGRIYFNIVRMPCVKDMSQDKQFSRKQFVPVQKRY